MKFIHPYPLYIFLNYVITFMLFPNLSLARTTALPPVWSILLFLVVYNLGDFAGKIIGDFRGSFNATSMTYLFFSRFFFFYTIPMMVASVTQEDHVLNNSFFPYLNQFLFSLTNGLVTSTLFLTQTAVSSFPSKMLPIDTKSMRGFWAGSSCSLA